MLILPAWVYPSDLLTTFSNSCVNSLANRKTCTLKQLLIRLYPAVPFKHLKIIPGLQKQLIWNRDIAGKSCSKQASNSKTPLTSFTIVYTEFTALIAIRVFCDNRNKSF